MRHRIHAARRRDRRWQIERQFGVVDGGCRKRGRGVAADALFGDADIPARRHFRAGIGCHDRDIREAGRRCRGLRQPDRRAATDDDEAVGVDPFDLAENALKGVARHGLAGGVAKALTAVGDRRDDLLRDIGARRRA